jgi:hypothetical protein
VEKLFDRKILTVQSDWGGEYQKLNTFFRQTGIAHHVSCTHAHQQNRSAERKHRHIVEVGLSLLAHASMPLKYWDEVFLAATYLINHLPTKVLEFSSLLERLFSKKLNYSGLRTFGCASWPNLRPFNTHKLQFCSKQCVFLGYNTMHKGFKCLNVADGRVYISRDAVFDETVFPFSKLNPNAGARLCSEILLLPSHLSVIPPGCELLNDPCTNVQTSMQSSAAENLVPIDQVGSGRDLAITSSVPSADSHSDSGLRRTPVVADPEASPCPAPGPKEDSGMRGNSRMVTGGKADPDNARGSPRLVPGVKVDPGIRVHASPSHSPM